MNSPSAQNLLDSIDTTILELDKLSLSNSNYILDNYLSKFLVVYICGIYEEAIENIIIEFTNKNTTRFEISNYISNSIGKNFRNPDFDKILKLIKSFKNSSWENSIKALKPSAGLAIDSIVANKNGLAHGQGITTTLNDVKDYYINSRPLIEKIDALLI